MASHPTEALGPLLSTPFFPDNPDFFSLLRLFFQTSPGMNQQLNVCPKLHFRRSPKISDRNATLRRATQYIHRNAREHSRIIRHPISPDKIGYLRKIKISVDINGPQPSLRLDIPVPKLSLVLVMESVNCAVTPPYKPPRARNTSSGSSHPFASGLFP